MTLYVLLAFVGVVFYLRIGYAVGTWLLCIRYNQQSGIVRVMRRIAFPIKWTLNSSPHDDGLFDISALFGDNSETHRQVLALVWLPRILCALVVYVAVCVLRFIFVICPRFLLTLSVSPTRAIRMATGWYYHLKYDTQETLGFPIG
jgi:hypothetical protein